jgi:hypothetical protein
MDCACVVDLEDKSGRAVFGSSLYEGEQAPGEVQQAVAASLGCGVPTAVADLHDGETVLDLGSGAGADVLISARGVGPTGKAIGLDMTDEMLEPARRNAEQAGLENVEFHLSGEACSVGSSRGTRRSITTRRGTSATACGSYARRCRRSPSGRGGATDPPRSAPLSRGLTWAAGHGF